MPERLTESLIRGLTYGGKPSVVRDAKVTGLLVAVNKTGKSYKVQRDLWQGQRGRRRLVKTVRHTLGTTDEMSLEQAREQAEDVIRLIKGGTDPNAPAADPAADAGTWTVRRMYEEYTADMLARDCAQRTVDDMMARLDRYLPKWTDLSIADVKRSMAREEHRRITRDHGPRSANQALRDFRAGYNFALKVVDDPDSLPGNPVAAVTFNKERASNRVIMPDDLPDWWARVQTLPNPLRQDMHMLGLLSGLRPGTLVSLRREWVNLTDRAISIPRMKSGRSFDLPLSGNNDGNSEPGNERWCGVVPKIGVVVPDPLKQDRRGHRDTGLERENSAQRDGPYSATHIPDHRPARGHRPCECPPIA